MSQINKFMGNLKRKKSNTIEKVLLGGIGSFFLVLLFPQGVRYFFRNVFAGMIHAVVTIVLSGLLTQKLFENITQDGRDS